MRLRLANLFGGPLFPGALGSLRKHCILVLGALGASLEHSKCNLCDSTHGTVSLTPVKMVPNPNVLNFYIVTTFYHSNPLKRPVDLILQYDRE